MGQHWQFLKTFWGKKKQLLTGLELMTSISGMVRSATRLQKYFGPMKMLI